MLNKLVLGIMVGIRVAAGMTGGSLVGELESLHLRLQGERKGDVGQSRTMDEIPSAEHGITEIGTERTPCFEQCKVYSAVPGSDGTFRYFGEANVRHPERQFGRVSEEDFEELPRFIHDTGPPRERGNP